MFEKELENLRAMYERAAYQSVESRKKMDELIAALDRLTKALSQVGI